MIHLVHVTAINHYNLGVSVNAVKAVQVIFGPFAYHQVNVSSATLIKLNINPDANAGYTTYYVATDINGNIIAEAKYVKGTTAFSLVATAPYEKDRLNFYEIKISDDSSTMPGILGY